MRVCKIPQTITVIISALTCPRWCLPWDRAALFTGHMDSKHLSSAGSKWIYHIIGKKIHRTGCKIINEVTTTRINTPGYTYEHRCADDPVFWGQPAPPASPEQVKFCHLPPQAFWSWRKEHRASCGCETAPTFSFKGHGKRIGILDLTPLQLEGVEMYTFYTSLQDDGIENSWNKTCKHCQKLLCEKSGYGWHPACRPTPLTKFMLHYPNIIFFSLKNIRKRICTSLPMYEWKVRNFKLDNLDFKPDNCTTDLHLCLCHDLEISCWSGVWYTPWARNLAWLP